jgi:site-specific DNA-cytosine methylase
LRQSDGKSNDGRRLERIPRDTKTSTNPTNRERVFITGAANRDFHTFNRCFRDHPEYDVSTAPGPRSRSGYAQLQDLSATINGGSCDSIIGLSTRYR